MTTANDNLQALNDAISVNEYGKTVLADHAPEWMRELVYACHGGKLPDDWTYDAIRDAADHLADCDPQDWDDAAADVADSVDVYTSDLLEWLRDYDNLAAANDAIDDGMAQTIEQAAMVAQSQDKMAIANAIIAACEDEADED